MNSDGLLHPDTPDDPVCRERTTEPARDRTGLWHFPTDGASLASAVDQSGAPVEQTLVEAQPDDVLELDELWSFVGSKGQQRWLWLALCRRTRQAVAYWLGDRSETSAIHLWEQLPHDYAHCRSLSDKWEPYRHVFDHKRHQQVNKDEGETNHVERWFNTLRQRLGRFTRKTLSFLKRDDMHEGVMRLFLHQYNLSCIS